MGYNDVQVVAAFNSCFDLEKWNALPELVRRRFKELLQYNRCKMVCFTDSIGMGLRTYIDEGRFVPDGGDEAEATGEVRMDLAGHWIRCPAKLWTDAPRKEKEWIVANERASIFLLDLGDDRADWDDEDLVTLDDDHYATWVCRHRATKMTREEAESLAGRVNGVVVRV